MDDVRLENVLRFHFWRANQVMLQVVGGSAFSRRIARLLLGHPEKLFASGHSFSAELGFRLGSVDSRSDTVLLFPVGLIQCVVIV